MTKIHSKYLAVLDQIPDPYDRERADIGIKRLIEAIQKLSESDSKSDLLKVVQSPDGSNLLASMFGNSPFLTQASVTDPGFLSTLLLQGPDESYRRALSPLKCSNIVSTRTIIPSQTAKTLRMVKRRAALAIALANITGLWTEPRVVQAISELAESSISHSVKHLLLQAHETGTLILPDPEDPEFGSGYIVLGMGKLGAQELNYSSDIDLIVVYDPEVISTTAPLKLQQNLVRLTRNLIHLLSERTEDGYVFRTDLRLRPDPSATPLAISVEAAERYYEGLGQNWERAAMIKARQVAGDKRAGERFLERLAPFVWRKNLDFATIQDIHAIKRQINAHRGDDTIAVEGHNVKLGRGGIREVEFFAQTQQLIWGGKHPELRQIKTEDALYMFANKGLIADSTAKELIDAYWYLRKVEHRLQMIADQQTHEIPPDEEGLCHVATFLGNKNSEEFRETLTGHLINVEGHYAQLFEEHADPPREMTPGNLIFTGTDDDPGTLQTLRQFGFGDASAVADIIRNWHRGHHRAMRTERARQILTVLVPRLLAAFGNSPDPDGALRRFDGFLSALPSGIQIFSLFRENPPLLEVVAEVMGSAPRLAGHLGRRPGLLDFVLEPEFYSAIPNEQTLEQEIRGILAAAPDFETCLNQSRIWAGDRMLQVGIHALRRLAPWSHISAAISNISGSVISALAVRVHAEFSKQHGTVSGGQWMVLGMGKLGGREMTPSSDLDLIVIYDHDSGAHKSDGKKSLAPGEYYSRLTKRLINSLTAPTAEGNLFEVDMRLRPSGTAGPLASHIDAFTKYHDESSWVWEHMALAKARAISGKAKFITQVNQIIEKTLTRSREPTQLLADVAEMRERIEKEHGTDSILEIKYFRGGIVDIEFIVQYLQLRHAADHPSILCTNTAGALENLAAHKLLDDSDAELLQRALSIFQSIQGHLRLTLEGQLDGRSLLMLPKPLQRSLADLGEFNTTEDLEVFLETLSTRVFTVFKKILGDAPTG